MSREPSLLLCPDTFLIDDILTDLANSIACFAYRYFSVIARPSFEDPNNVSSTRTKTSSLLVMNFDLALSSFLRGMSGEKNIRFRTSPSASAIIFSFTDTNISNNYIYTFVDIQFFAKSRPKSDNKIGEACHGARSYNALARANQSPRPQSAKWPKPFPLQAPICMDQNHHMSEFKATASFCCRTTRLNT